jgi:hypothetical protein
VLPYGAALTALVSALERLGIPWLGGGSVASTVHGEPRTTQGVDIVADLRPEHVAPLVAALHADFFVDTEFLRETVRVGSSCNVIHRTTGFKVDIFVLRRREYSRVEMSRRHHLELQPGLGVWVASAEDSLLSKLEWYEKGGRVSDRQWRDVLGIMKTQRGALDSGYLERWAKELGLTELLHRAQREAVSP